MGFFNTIAKLAGKVVKAGASKLTMGASDVLLKQLKGTGQLKQAVKAVAGKQMTAQQAAAATAITPSVKSPARQTVRAALRPMGYDRTLINHSDETIARERKRIAASGKRQPIRKMAKTPRAKTPKVKRPSNRKPPKGGLNLKAMAVKWRAAGKPGTWLNWIKSNPIKG